MDTLFYAILTGVLRLEAAVYFVGLRMEKNIENIIEGTSYYYHSIVSIIS